MPAVSLCPGQGHCAPDEESPGVVKGTEPVQLWEQNHLATLVSLDSLIKPALPLLLCQPILLTDIRENNVKSMSLTVGL